MSSKRLMSSKSANVETGRMKIEIPKSSRKWTIRVLRVNELDLERMYGLTLVGRGVREFLRVLWEREEEE
jgi:hypothetical protein